MSSEISSQNDEYRSGLLHDIQIRNKRIIELMDITVAQQEAEIANERLDIMNSFSPRSRRRLMGGEKLEDILPDRFKTSKYYNTSDEGAAAIPRDVLFEYQIGDHIMAYEINEININNDLKFVNLPVVVYNPEIQEYCDMTYTTDDIDIYNILSTQLSQRKVSLSQLSSSSDSGGVGVCGESNNVNENDQFKYDIEGDEIPEWVQEDYEESPFASEGGDLRNIFNGGLENAKRSASQVTPLNTHVNTSLSNHIPNNNTNRKSIKKIQDKLYEQLITMFQGESIYSNQVYTPEMEQRIDELLKCNYFPFQIVNDLIAEFCS